MLAALRGPNATEGGLSAARGRRKVIYLAPSRALVSEKAREWRERLGRIGITFAELTGDNDFGGDVWGEIENVDAILATPEKFDRVTRLDANRGGMSFFSDVAAVLIDEVHLIGDIRGGCLEAIVSRLKLLSKSSALLQSHLRNVRTQFSGHNERFFIQQVSQAKSVCGDSGILSRQADARVFGQSQ
jgi:ATP-dependent DNA helicase HFM1/MER3